MRIKTILLAAFAAMSVAVGAEPAADTTAAAPSAPQSAHSTAALLEKAGGMWQDSGIYGFLTAEPRDWAVDTGVAFGGEGGIDTSKGIGKDAPLDENGNTLPAAMVGEDGALHYGVLTGYYDANGKFVHGHPVHMLFGMPYGVGQLLMIVVCVFLIYLAFVKGFEPLLLFPIGMGGLLANVPLAGVTTPTMMMGGTIVNDGLTMVGGQVTAGGFLSCIFQAGIDTGLFPILIFFGVGAMTDFGPLIANPKMLLLGAAAQLGIFSALLGAVLLHWVGIDFTLAQAASIGIIGGADGPTSIWLTTKLAPDLTPSSRPTSSGRSPWRPTATWRSCRSSSRRS